MADETLTIALEGDISLIDFTETMKRFRLLIDALSQEVADSAKIDWRVEDLHAGSAIATIRGLSPRPEAAESVIRAFATVGESLQRDEVIPYSEKVKQRAGALAESVKGTITSIRFETRFSDAVIAGRREELQASQLIYSYGQVTGTVQTLSSRRGLKFTLYDPIFDKPISCYLREDQEETMRGAWGRKAIVSGLIGREPYQRRPVVVRDIKELQIIEDTPPGSYRRARGAIALAHNSGTSEALIRGIRDEW